MRFIISVFFIACTLAAFAQKSQVEKAHPAIDSKRQIKLRFASDCGIKINGKTNVNSFECECNDQEPFEEKAFLGTVENGRIDFDEASLAIPISYISCGNKMMNEDLYELLDSENHPNIYIEFIDANWDLLALWKQNPDSDQSIGYFDVDITIANVKRRQKVHIFRTEVDQTKLLLATSGDILMNLRDFNIEPPVKFMGMVKVKEEIHLELDLNFHWSDADMAD